MKKFAINQFCYDSENKEHVRITNGVVTADGALVPTEAIAFRVVGMNRGLIQVGFTYKKVNSEFLTPVKDGGQFEAISCHPRIVPNGLQFIGRV